MRLVDFDFWVAAVSSLILLILSIIYSNETTFTYGLLMFTLANVIHNRCILKDIKDKKNENEIWG